MNVSLCCFWKISKPCLGSDRVVLQAVENICTVLFEVAGAEFLWMAIRTEIAIATTDKTSRRATVQVEKRTMVRPIPVGLTESHDQPKGWIARRSAVDL
jgi:hypothetical protein